MKQIILFTGAVLLLSISSQASGAFGLRKPESRQHVKIKKPKKQGGSKKPDVRLLQAQAEADMKRHQNEARLVQFQQMQQSQQKGYQQQMQAEQNSLAPKR